MMIRFTVLFLAALAAKANADNNFQLLSPNVKDLTTVVSDQQPILIGDPINVIDITVGHYGPPPDGCLADEQMFQIQGVPGKVCLLLMGCYILWRFLAVIE